MVFANNNVLRQARFIRRNRVSARSVAEQAHDRAVRAIEDTENPSLRAACAVGETAATFDARKDVSAVHGVAHRIASDEEVSVQIFSRRIRHNKAVTIAMRYQSPGQLIHFRARRRGGFYLSLSALTLLRALLHRRGILGTLLLFWQADSAVGIFVNIAALFHFSRELHERPPRGMAQIKRCGNLSKALRLAGTGQLREDVGFGDGRARFSRAWHGWSIVCKSACKRWSCEKIRFHRNFFPQTCLLTLRITKLARFSSPSPV